MKTILALIVLCTFAIARAQQLPAAGAAPVPPIPPATPVPPRPIPEDIARSVNNSVRVAIGAAEDATAAGARLAARALPGPDALETKLQELRTYAVGSGTSRGSRTLVVHTGESDAAATANAEEDLAIMARILDKATRSSPDDGRRFASGIEVDGGVFGSSSGARNILLEGYGALFLLSVKYPLIAPPEKPEAPKVKDTSSDDWKKAREEIQGTSREGRAELWGESYGHTRGSAEEFDADKVEKLKESLLDSLKNATHIRALQPNDYVTVVVQGAEGARTDVVRDLKLPRSTKGKDGNNAGAVASVNATGYIRRSTGQGQTVMTLRVKKSDVDAFAQGKLTPEEFRKKAALQVYFRKPDAANAANFFMQTVR